MVVVQLVHSVSLTDEINGIQSSNAGNPHPYVLTEQYVNLNIQRDLQPSTNRQTSRLPVVWINSSIIPCGCLVFTNFCTLCNIRLWFRAGRFPNAATSPGRNVVITEMKTTFQKN
jgi:hypothetical protein